MACGSTRIQHAFQAHYQPGQAAKKVCFAIRQRLQLATPLNLVVFYRFGPDSQGKKASIPFDCAHHSVRLPKRAFDERFLEDQ